MIDFMRTYKRLGAQQMYTENTSVVRTQESVLATNKVLRNTYLLLSMTLVFSAGCAGFAMLSNAQPLNIFVTLIGIYGLMFLTQKLSNSSWGLLSVFAFTGFMGYTLGPLLNMYIQTFSNGSELIMTALGGTGFIFFALSGYVLTTKKDFSYLGGFLFAAVMVALIAMIVGFFFNIPGLQLIISAAFMLISSGMILYQTSMILNGGEKNYIMATITLFVALYNLFVSLLRLLSAFSGRN